MMREGSVKELRWALLGLLSLFFIGLLSVATVAEFGWTLIFLERHPGIIVALIIATIVFLIFDKK